MSAELYSDGFEVSLSISVTSVSALFWFTLSSHFLFSILSPMLPQCVQVFWPLEKAIYGQSYLFLIFFIRTFRSSYISNFAYSHGKESVIRLMQKHCEEA